MNKNLPLSIALFFLVTINIQAANRYWVAGATSNWNNTANWSTANGGSGGASVPLATDVAIFNANGLGNCNIDILATIGGLTVDGYTSTIDLTGFIFTSAGNVTLKSGTINDTPGTGSLTINSTATARFTGTVFGAIINATSSRVYLSGSTFNAAAVFTKNGGGNDGGSGGNTFNSTVSITNSGTGYFMLANTTPDIFNDDLTLTNSGTQIIYLAHNSAGNLFNGNITINATSGNGIRFGQGSLGTATLASTKTMAIGGSGFSAGRLEIARFTQLGTSAQTLTLTGSAILDLETNCIWNGNVNVSAPRIYIESNTFNGTAVFTKTGANNDYNVGGNTFSSTASIINDGTGHLYFAQTNPDTFNNDATLIVSGTGRIYLANAAIGNVFNGSIFINYITNSNIYIGNSSGTSTLSSGKTINIIGAGASGTGNLYLEEFTQLGATTQGIVMNGTGVLSIGPNSTFNGDLSTSTPRIYLRGSTFNGVSTFEKTGASNDASAGGNTFNMDANFINSGSGYFMMGNGTLDTYDGNVNITNSGTYNMYFAQGGSGHIVNGNLTVNNTATGSSNSIYLARNTGA
ncbi:MAG: hypothetical protein HRT72_07110, partial [Flavobacteriales bacterium]|nr:hypothetical protein [Flavobacteriales bacterium]